MSRCSPCPRCGGERRWYSHPSSPGSRSRVCRPCDSARVRQSKRSLETSTLAGAELSAYRDGLWPLMAALLAEPPGFEGRA